MLLAKTKEEKKHFRLGVSGKMILNIAIPIAIILIILAIIITSMVVNTIRALQNKDIESQMDAVSSQVTQYFDPFFVSGQFISDRPSVRQIMAQMEQSPATYRFEMSPLYQQVLRDLQYADTVGGETVQGVWLAGVKNNQFIQSNGYVTDASFDISGRIWYQLLKQNPGENIMTPAYTELSTGNLVVTVAIPYNNAAGEMIGVVGLDLSLDTLKEYFSQIKIGENGYITLYDSSQNIIYHPDSTNLMKNLKDIPYSDNIKQPLENNRSSEVIKYQRDGKTYYGGTCFIERYYWTVLACMTGSEYMRADHDDLCHSGNRVPAVHRHYLAYLSVPNPCPGQTPAIDRSGGSEICRGQSEFGHRTPNQRLDRRSGRGLCAYAGQSENDHFGYCLCTG